MVDEEGKEESRTSVGRPSSLMEEEEEIRLTNQSDVVSDVDDNDDDDNNSSFNTAITPSVHSLSLSQQYLSLSSPDSAV